MRGRKSSCLGGGNEKKALRKKPRWVRKDKDRSDGGQCLNPFRRWSSVTRVKVGFCALLFPCCSAQKLSADTIARENTKRKNGCMAPGMLEKNKKQYRMQTCKR